MTDEETRQAATYTEWLAAEIGVVQKAPLLANTDNVTFERFAHG